MMKPLGEVGAEYADWASGTHSRVPSGISWLDLLMHGGVARGELCTVLARSGVGKTWWGLNVIQQNLEVPTVFFSMEMDARFALARLAALHTGVTTWELENHYRHDTETHWSIATVMGDFKMLGLVDDPGLSALDMMRYLEEYEQRFGEPARLVVIDHQDLILSLDMAGGVERVERISYDVKSLAREADVAVVMLAQAKRGEGKKEEDGEWYQNQGHRPLTTTDLPYGGDRAPDYIIGLFRPGLNPALRGHGNTRDLRVQYLKDRSGGLTFTQGVEVYYDDGQTGRIRETEGLPYLLNQRILELKARR